jgi:hypothetical protein
VCLLLAACAQTAPSRTTSESLGQKRYSIRSYEEGTTSAYDNWDKEARRLCGGPYKDEDKFFQKDASGAKYLVGVISCQSSGK